MFELTSNDGSTDGLVNRLLFNGESEFDGDVRAESFTTGTVSHQHLKDFVRLGSHYDEIFKKQFPAAVKYKYNKEARAEFGFKSNERIGWLLEEV